MPLLIKARIRPCGATDGKAKEVAVEMDGSQTIGELRELIADQARLPPQALVFYTPQLMHTDAAAASSFAARGVADSIPLAEALKGTDHRIDVHVDESGMPEFVTGEQFLNAGKGNIGDRDRSKIHFGGHGGLAGHKGQQGPSHSAT